MALQSFPSSSYGPRSHQWRYWWPILPRSWTPTPPADSQSTPGRNHLDMLRRAFSAARRSVSFSARAYRTRQHAVSRLPLHNLFFSSSFVPKGCKAFSGKDFWAPVPGRGGGAGSAGILPALGWVEGLLLGGPNPASSIPLWNARQRRLARSALRPPPSPEQARCLRSCAREGALSERCKSSSGIRSPACSRS